MNKYSVFFRLLPEQRKRLFELLDVRIRSFRRGEKIMELAEDDSKTGILMEGLAYLISNNDSGEENIIDYYQPGHIFSSHFTPDTNVNLYSIIAKKSCIVYFFSYESISHNIEVNDGLHLRFLDNIITSTSCRNQIHIDILSQRTIRQKLLTYFGYLHEITQQNELTLPIPLSDLAAYICTDRCAMMRELKKMNNEGLIISKGQQVTLI